MIRRDGGTRGIIWLSRGKRVQRQLARRHGRFAAKKEVARRTFSTEGRHRGPLPLWCRRGFRRKSCRKTGPRWLWARRCAWMNHAEFALVRRGFQRLSPPAPDGIPRWSSGRRLPPAMGNGRIPRRNRVMLWSRGVVRSAWRCGRWRSSRGVMCCAGGSRGIPELFPGGWNVILIMGSRTLSQCVERKNWPRKPRRLTGKKENLKIGPGQLFKQQLPRWFQKRMSRPFDVLHRRAWPQRLHKVPVAVHFHVRQAIFHEKLVQFSHNVHGDPIGAITDHHRTGKAVRAKNLNRSCSGHFFHCGLLQYSSAGKKCRRGRIGR